MSETVAVPRAQRLASPPSKVELDLLLGDDVTILEEPAAKAPFAPPAPAVQGQPAFDGGSTVHFQARLKNKAPEWFCSFLASNHREKRRFRDELVHMKGAWPLLMKQRYGGKWTPEERVQLKAMVRSASSVSPYLFIWAVPGSMLLLPFLAWYLDRKRRNRSAPTQL